jgi:hypothetical protein
MTLHHMSDEALIAFIRDYTQARSITLHGPAEIEYGWGWEPTLSFWSDSRRMHLYGDMAYYKQGLTVELAEVGPPKTVRCIELNEPEALAELIDLFFRQNLALAAMTNLAWRSPCGDHDKFIPHPPNGANPANIVELVKHGQPWQPAKEAPAPSSRFVQWFRKLTKQK